MDSCCLLIRSEPTSDLGGPASCGSEDTTHANHQGTFNGRLDSGDYWLGWKCAVKEQGSRRKCQIGREKRRNDL